MTEERREARRTYFRNWQRANLDKVKGYQRKQYQQNRDDLRAYRHLFNLAFPEKARVYTKRYLEKNRDVLKQRTARYRSENREQVRAKDVQYKMDLEKRDVNAKIKGVLRRRMLGALKSKRTPKADSTMRLLGCSIEFFKAHLECQFEPGMIWGNHGVGPGKWNIDHIMPCASFKLEQEQQQRLCFHFTNLQPLWHEENNSKGAKISERIAA